MERFLGAGTEGMDLEKAALLRRLNAFFLFAGVTFLILTLALIVVWYLDPTQYMLALYTGGTGVGILLVRNWLVRYPNRGRQHFAIYLIFGFGLLVIVFFSIQFTTFAEKLPYITPLLCPAILFLWRFWVSCG